MNILFIFDTDKMTILITTVYQFVFLFKSTIQAVIQIEVIRRMSID